MWLKLSSLIGDMQALQQCAGERYLISLIIITPPDQSPPPDCCPSPNLALYHVDTDQINCADARGSMLGRKLGLLVKIKRCESTGARTERSAGYVLTGVVSCRPRGKDGWN